MTYQEQLPKRCVPSFLFLKASPNPSQTSLRSPSHQPLMQNQEQKLSEPWARRDSYKSGSLVRVFLYYLESPSNYLYIILERKYLDFSVILSIVL